MGQPIRLMVVDDHTLVRQGLCSLLKTASDVEVVAEATDCEQALKRAGSSDLDLVILDLNLGGQSGLVCLEQLKRSQPELPVLILSVHHEDRLVREAFRLGANGFLVKSATHAELLSAIGAVALGGYYIHSRIRAQISDLLGSSNSSPALTERESEMIELIKLGKNNRQVADEMHLSLSSVKGHLQRLFERFDVTDRTQLVVRAIHEGWVDTTLAPRDREGHAREG